MQFVAMRIMLPGSPLQLITAALGRRQDSKSKGENSMLRTVLVALMMLVAVPAMADHPAVGYWFVEVASLTKEVNRVGGLAKIAPSTLDAKAECHGHFKGNCDMWIHARTVQIRMKGEDDGRTLKYSLSMSWPPVKRGPVESHGQIVVTDVLAAKDGWQKDKYVLLLRRLNLKE
jgi:hypothetical protein